MSSSSSFRRFPPQQRPRGRVKLAHVCPIHFQPEIFIKMLNGRMIWQVPVSSRLTVKWLRHSRLPVPPGFSIPKISLWDDKYRGKKSCRSLCYKSGNFSIQAFPVSLGIGPKTFHSCWICNETYSDNTTDLGAWDRPIITWYMKLRNRRRLIDRWWLWENGLKTAWQKGVRCTDRQTDRQRGRQSHYSLYRRADREEGCSVWRQADR